LAAPPWKTAFGIGLGQISVSGVLCICKWLVQGAVKGICNDILLMEREQRARDEAPMDWNGILWLPWRLSVGFGSAAAKCQPNIRLQRIEQVLCFLFLLFFFKITLFSI